MQATDFDNSIKFWMVATSGLALDLKTGVPAHQVEDEEGRTHLLIHLLIKEEGERPTASLAPRSRKV
jgi:hypothetical protein